MIKSDYVLIEYKCPICRKWCVGSFPRIFQNDLKTIAHDHGNHIVLIDYDADGRIRFITGIRKARNPNNYIKKIRCIRCERVITIPRISSSFDQFALDHDDHAVILYIFENNYFIDIVDLYHDSDFRLFENTVKKIVSKIGVRKLAEILIRALLLKDRRIIVPRNVLYPLRYLIAKLGELNIFILEPGDMEKDARDIKTSYLERIINQILELPERKALARLKTEIEAIRKFLKSIFYHQKIQSNEKFQNFSGIIQEPSLLILLQDLINGRISGHCGIRRHATLKQ